jgi:hypothetical protein
LERGRGRGGGEGPGERPVQTELIVNN